MLGPPPNESNVNSNPSNNNEIKNLDFYVQASSFSLDEIDWTDIIPKSVSPLKEISMCNNISIIPIQKKTIKQAIFQILSSNLLIKRVLKIICLIMLFIGCSTVFTFIYQLFSATSNYAMNIDNDKESTEKLMMGISEKMCSLADMLYVDTKCQKDQDFCITFSNSMMNFNERLELLRDTFHWMPTVDGIFQYITSLDAISNCKYFIGISNYNLYKWELNSKNPKSLSIQLTSLIKFASNDKFAILSGKEGNAYKFNITSFQVTAFSTFLFDKNIYTNVLISNDNKLIFLYCEKKGKIYVAPSDMDIFIQFFEGIDQKVHKMILSEPNNDLIISDAVSVKIYFIHSNKPAYSINNAREFKKLRGKYHELIHFENYFATGNYSVVS